MAKLKITDFVSEILNDFLKEEGYELWNVEFIKEGKDWFLRVYVDIAPDEGCGEKRYISTDDCEKVSRYLSAKLDEADPIEQNYYLEVSSPGIDRKLITIEHYRRYVGSEVESKLYKSKDGIKVIQGILTDAGEEEITIRSNDGKEWILQMKEVAGTRPVVTF